MDDLSLLCLSGEQLETDFPRMAAAFTWLKRRLEEIGIHVNMSKTFAFLSAPARQQLQAAHPEAWREVAKEQLAGVNTVAGDGVVLVGVPIGPAAFVQQQVRETLRAPSTVSLLAGLARIRDTQVAMALLRSCFLPRAMYTIRNVAHQHAHDEARRFDALCIGAFAAIAQEPTVATGAPAAAAPSGETAPAPSSCDDVSALIAHVHADNWRGDIPVALTAAQRLQARLRVRHGGFGLTSVEGRCHAAYTARTLAALEPALASLSHTQVLNLVTGARSLLQLPLLQHLRTSIAALSTTIGAEAMPSKLSHHRGDISGQSGVANMQLTTSRS